MILRASFQSGVKKILRTGKSTFFSGGGEIELTNTVNKKNVSNKKKFFLIRGFCLKSNVCFSEWLEPRTEGGGMTRAFFKRGGGGFLGINVEKKFIRCHQI